MYYRLHIRPPARGALARGLLQAFVACLVGVALFSCSGDTDPVQKLLNEVETAVEDRSADGVGALLSPGFQGPGGIGRAEALGTLRRYLAGYQTIRIELYDIEVERALTTATVSLTAELCGDARRIGGLSGFLPPAALYRFDLELAVEDDHWLIAAADWKALPPPDM